MKKAFLPMLVVGLIILPVISTCFTVGATKGSPQIEKINDNQLQKIGMGIIKGTVTNQHGNPVSFVRVSAFGDKSGGGREYGFAITHLLIKGKGKYEMQVEAGRYLFVRAARLPLYIGAWAGPVYVEQGETITIDLSVTYIGPESVSHATINRNNYITPLYNYHTVMNSLKNFFFYHLK